MKSLLKGLAPLILFLLTCSGEAVADPVVIDPVWKLTATNNTGMIVFGFQLIFTGTGGSLHDPMVVMNAPEAGNPTVTVISLGSGISVMWEGSGLPLGGSFMVQFSTDNPNAPVIPISGFWSVPEQKPIDPIRDQVTVQEIPEPVTLLLFATGLIGVVLKSRKKLKSSA